MSKKISKGIQNYENILFYSCQLFAVNTEAQNAVIELNSNKISIEELFKEIEKQTDYLVIYSTSGLRSNFELSLTKKKAKVSEYLEEALAGHNLKYEFVNVEFGNKEIPTG